MPSTIPLAAIADSPLVSFEALSGPGVSTEKPPTVVVRTEVLEEVMPPPFGIDMLSVQARAQQLTRSSKEIFDCSKSDDAQIDDAGLDAANGFIENLGNLLREINAVSAPREERDPDVAAFLLPLSLRHWRHHTPEGNAQVLVDLCRSIYPVSGEQIKMPFLEWQRIVHQLFDARDVTHMYPAPLDYIRASETLRTELPEAKIESIKSEESSEAREYVEAPAISSKALRALLKKLIQEARDVDPLKMPGISDQINCKVAPKKPIVQFLLELHNRLEMLLEDFDRTGGFPESASLPMLGVRKEALATVEMQLELGATESLGTQMLKLFHNTRGALLAAATALKHFPEHDLAQEILSALHTPLQRAPGKYLTRLMQYDDPTTLSLISGIFSDPICADPQRNRWSFPAAELSSKEVLEFAVGSTLFSAAADKSLALIKASFPDDFPVYRLVRGAANGLRNGNISQLAHELERQIVSQARLLAITSDVGRAQTPEQIAYGGLTLLIVLNMLGNNSGTRERLLSQIPSIEKVNEIAAGVQSLVGAQRYLPFLAKNIISKFGPSLTSCNLSPEDLYTLQRVVSNYQLLAEYPELREGLQGNTLYRSGILLSGPPGVGKTYLTEVLASELGAARFRLRPFEKRQTAELYLDPPQEDSLNARITEVTAKLVAEAEKGTICLFEIDEAEHFLPKRNDVHIAPARRDTCVYLLEVLNEIRIKYPNVLIVIATNHADMLDVAGIRDGRIDYEVALTYPDAKQRRQALERDIARHDQSGAITAGQLDDLVQLTENWIFVGISSTINEYFRFESLRRSKTDRGYKPNFKDLREEFVRVAQQAAQNRGQSESKDVLAH